MSWTVALQEPEYSALLPETEDRQAPVHPVGDFAADHPPAATVVPFASSRVHVPVTAPVFGSATAVHVPFSVSPVLLRAVQPPFNGAGCALDPTASSHSMQRAKMGFWDERFILVFFPTLRWVRRDNGRDRDSSR